MKDLSEYYKILGLSPNASKEEIKKAYNKLSFQFHPDRNPSDSDAEEKFKQIQEAYDIINNPDKYYKKNNNNYPEFSSIFEEMFGFGKKNKTKKGRDVFENIELTLEDISKNSEKEITVHKREFCPVCTGIGFSEYKPCTKCSGSGKTYVKQMPFTIYTNCNLCNGSGRAGQVDCNDCKGEGSKIIDSVKVIVKIPAGIDDGMSLKLGGYGHPCQDGVSGDLYVKVNIKKHKLFTKDGLNLHIDVPVSYGELVLGTIIEIPLLNKDRVKLMIPAGTNQETVFRIKNMGIDGGDIFCHLVLNIPKKINEDYKKLMKSIVELDKIDKRFDI